MHKPFVSMDEVAKYISGNLIQCLECGRHYRQLTRKHLQTHGLTHNEYRDKWGLPRGTPLMGKESRRKRSLIARQLIDQGAIDYSHLPRAVEASRTASRGRHVPAVKEEQSRLMSELRPGDWSMLPAGSKRADGRDAERAREYQRAYRSLKKGDPEPMRLYIEKWRK